jgi:hypothetical protein
MQKAAATSMLPAEKERLVVSEPDVIPNLRFEI